MVKVANLVHSTTIHMAHSTGAIPGPVISCVSVFNQIHRMWRWFRLGKIYTNPDNFLKLAAGHALNFAAGNSVLLRISAVCVLIATRIMDCVSQHFKLQEAWNQLVLCLKKRFITPVKVAWEKKISQNFLSASTVAWWKFHALHLWDVVHRFVVCLLNLCKEIFILCMRITDAVETFALKPSTTNESINLLFVNASQWISNLVENKQILLEGLKSNKEIIDAILKGIHSFINADQLIKTAEDALNATEKIHASVQGISHTFGVFMMTCLKKWGFEFLHGLGLHHLIPKQLLPPTKPPWEIPKYKMISARHPPIEWITKPSIIKTKETESLVAEGLKKLEEQKAKVAISFSDLSQSITTTNSFTLIDKKKNKNKSEGLVKNWSLV